MILHGFIFLAANGISLFILVFDDKQHTVTRPQEMIGMVVTFYSLAYLAGLFFSSRVKAHFMLYTYINLGILLLLMACFMGLRDKSYRDDVKNARTALAAAPRDFVCPDGSFFTLNRNDPQYWSIAYCAVDAAKNPQNRLDVGVVYVGEGKTKLNYGVNAPVPGWLLDALDKSRNKEGKSLLEMYPEKDKMVLSRDFVCPDGSFFTIFPTGYKFPMVYHYTQDEFKAPANPVYVAIIVDGKTKLNYGPDNPAPDWLRGALENCKNRDGKSLPDIYPF
jgi:hypothetical protein